MGRCIENIIAGHLSAPRLAPYIAATGSLTAAIPLYRWNLELSGAIHEALGVVEVTMRNSIDQNLQTWNRGRWAPKSTYDSARERAFKDSNLRDPSHPRHGVSPNHDDIVAHITFGTWVKLLPSRHDGMA